VQALFCDQPHAPVINKAKKYNIETFVMPFDKLKMTKSLYEKEVTNCLKNIEFDWICLAGYMRILSNQFIQSFYDTKLGYSKIVNIHPSLLPSFKGKSAYEDAFDYGVQISGVSIHLVVAQIDSGPILLQESFVRRGDDTLSDFKQRGLETEYKIYRQLLDKLKTLNPVLTEKTNCILWRDKCDWKSIQKNV